MHKNAYTNTTIDTETLHLFKSNILHLNYWPVQAILKNLEDYAKPQKDT